MQARVKNKGGRSNGKQARVRSAATAAIELIESRVLMSTTTITAWNFDSLAIGTNLSPAASTGAGTALTVGFQTGSTNANSPGGVYAYPNPNASGTGDNSDILNGTANQAKNNLADHSSTGATTTSTAGTNPAWRIRGNNDGWSANAAVGSQGAQFTTSTTGSSGISVTFDIDASSTSAASEVAVEYTTDGTTWNVLPASALTAGTAANGTTDGVTVQSNSTDPNVVNGGYFQFANNADALYWQHGLTANLSGIAGVNDNPNFGIRIVNAATGASEFEVGGTAYPAAGAGNWRLDNVQVAATTTTLSAPAITTSPASQSIGVGQSVSLTAAASGSPTPSVQWQVSTNGGTSFTNITGATAATYTFTAAESTTGYQYRAVFTNNLGSATTTAATVTTLGTPISQWIFASGAPASPNGNTSPGTANAPYPTMHVNPIPTDITTGAGAQVIGFGPINYTGVEQYPEADITQLASGVTPTYKPWVWRVRAGNGSGPTGSPGSPEGWSQYAPQYSQGVEFAVDTTGFSDITLHFDWNGGGIRDMQPQYTPDGGNTWINVGPVVVEQSDYYGITPGNTPTGVTVNLQGITAANNNPNFGIRLVAAYDPALPLIADGNLYDGPLGTMHGQYASGKVGPVNAQQTITLGDGSDGGVTGGTFDLSFNGQTAAAGTPDITYSTDTSNAGLAANAAAIQNYLAAIPGIGAGNVSVVPADQTGYRYTVTFTGALGGAPQNNLVIAGNNLTGPAAAASNVATWVPGAANGVTRYVDGGGAWSLANFSFNGYSTSGAPSIVTEPAPQTVVGGTNATFSSTAYGDSPITSVQWQVSNDAGKSWTNTGPLVTMQTSSGTTTLSGTNTATSTLTVATGQSLSQNGYQYRAVFGNALGSVASLGGLLSVVAPQAPSVTLNPISQSVQTGNVVDFTAAGAGSPNPTVQWQVSTDNGSTWSNLTDDGISVNGSTTTTLELVSSLTENGYQYRALFTNEVSSAPSSAATLTVLNPETTLTDWDFSSHPQTYDNSPSPTVGTGVASAFGFDLPYNPSDPASGDGVSAEGSVNADDVNNSAGTANTAFAENTWRIRGGVSATAGGEPSNGWSNLALPGQQGAQFSVSTAGYNSVYITFDWYATKSGIRDMQLQYTLDGTNYINYGSPLQAVPDDFYGATFANDPITHGTPVPIVMDLTNVPGAANNPNLAIRMTAAYDALLPDTTDVNGTHGQYANAALAGPNTAVVYNGSKGNWRFDNIVFHAVPQTTPPTLVGAPVINGDNPSGLFNAAGQTTPGTQRSMVEDIVYTFNEPVTITNANAAFTLAVAGLAGGTLPTTLYAQAVANSNGTRWAVSLTGMPEGTIGSIANGEYSITINPAYVFAAADGVTSMAPGTGRTDTFYRLYGDVFGTRNVNNADYNLFKKSINTYNPMFDDFGTGATSSNADYNVFKKDLNLDYSSDGFVTTI